MIPTPANLRLIGGYRVPPFLETPTSKWKGSTGFTNGGGTVHVATSGQVTAWLNNHQARRQVVSASTTKPLGAGDPLKWPLLTQGDCWNVGELFGAAAKADGFQVPEGMIYDPCAARLWIALRSWYATAPDAPQWLASIDYPSKTLNPIQPKLSANEQAYGGGLTLIPAEWANLHTGGLRLAFASGGYRSGQRASMGPTFAATSLAPAPLPPVKPIMAYAQTAEARFEANRERIAIATADYDPGNVSWVLPPQDGVGRWPGSTIWGNGAWVESRGFSAVLYMANRPLGTLNYALQNETFTKSSRSTLYVVDPADLAKAAAGELPPHGVPLTFHDWTTIQNGGVPGKPRSLTFSGGLLWALHAQAWKPNSSSSESYPLIAAYEVTP